MQEKEQIFYKKLQNGLKIVLRRTDCEVAYVGIMIGAGTRDEREEQGGLAHYVEHTVFKGTEKHSAKQIISHIEGNGGEINAYTTKEETTYYAATPVGRWRQTLQIIGEMVSCPTFPKEETDKEKEVILDEIDSYEDSLSELIYDDFESLVFEGCGLGRRILGSKKSVRHIASHAQIAKDWIGEQYVPERMVVFAQGRIDPAKLVEEVEQFCLRYSFAHPSKYLRNSFGQIPPTKKLFIRKHTHQVHGMMGGLAYELGHEHQLAAYLLNNILGGGSLNSRLNMSLREKRGLVYSVESQYVPLSDTGYWSVYFACDAKDKERCTDLVRAELRRLREEPLSSSQLSKHLKQLYGQMAIAAENQENQVLSMAKHMLYFGYSPSWQETYERIQKVTSEELQTVANELYAEEKIFCLFYDKM